MANRREFTAKNAEGAKKGRYRLCGEDGVKGEKERRFFYAALTGRGEGGLLYGLSQHADAG
jgi:hypothetical protein